MNARRGALLFAGLAAAGTATGFAIARTRRSIVSVWWDIGSARTMPYIDEYIRQLKRAHVREVVVEIDQQTDRLFNTGWRPDQLRTFGRKLKRAGIRMSIMTWPWPTREYEASLRQGLEQLRRARVPIYALEFDVEGYNWGDDDVRGFASRAEAAATLVRIVRQSGLVKRVRVTMHAGRVRVEWAEPTDATVVQTYSTYEDGDPDFAIGARYGPGAAQIRGVQKAKEAGAAEVHLGLPAWDQEGFPQVGPEVPMAIALAAADELEVPRVAYWNASMIFGHERERPNPYAAAFLREAGTRRPIVRRRALAALGEYV